MEGGEAWNRADSTNVATATLGSFLATPPIQEVRAAGGGEVESGKSDDR